MNWKTGDEVYSVQTYSGVEKGKIKELLENGASIQFFNHGGTGGAAYENMFLTRDEAEQYMHDKSERIADEYRAQIKTKEDCLRFIFNNCGNFEEYTDNEANEVGIEKVKEMFGVDIE